jgi:hypothetical protein
MSTAQILLPGRPASATASKREFVFTIEEPAVETDKSEDDLLRIVRMVVTDDEFEAAAIAYAVGPFLSRLNVDFRQHEDECRAFVAELVGVCGRYTQYHHDADSSADDDGWNDSPQEPQLESELPPLAEPKAALTREEIAWILEWSEAKALSIQGPVPADPAKLAVFLMDVMPHFKRAHLERYPAASLKKHWLTGPAERAWPHRHWPQVSEFAAPIGAFELVTKPGYFDGLWRAATYRVSIDFPFSDHCPQAPPLDPGRDFKPEVRHRLLCEVVRGGDWQNLVVPRAKLRHLTREELLQVVEIANEARAGKERIDVIELGLFSADVLARLKWAQGEGHGFAVVRASDLLDALIRTRDLETAMTDTGLFEMVEEWQNCWVDPFCAVRLKPSRFVFSTDAPKNPLYLRSKKVNGGPERRWKSLLTAASGGDGRKV